MFDLCYQIVGALNAIVYILSLGSREALSYHRSTTYHHLQPIWDNGTTRQHPRNSRSAFIVACTHPVSRYIEQRRSNFIYHKLKGFSLDHVW